MRTTKKNNKIISFLTALVIMLNILPMCIVQADDTVAISTVNDLKEFFEKCVYDEYSKNKKFVLQNDIDLNGVEIKSAEVFCGTFEGGGHSIKNVKLSFEGSNKGLFCSVTKEGQIRDLNVTGDIKVTVGTDTESVFRQKATSILSKTDINTQNFDKGSKGAGGLVGYNAGKIVNCSYGGNIKGQKQVGGLVGYNAMTGVVDSSANSATVVGDSETGGIVGYNEGRIKLSRNDGKVCPDANENTVNAGGICGNNEGAVVICTNNGIVGGESFGDNIGGIVGTQSGEVRECINNAAVQGRRSVGGVVGRFEPYTDIDLSYQSAKAAMEKDIDTFQNDISSARTKLIEYGLKLLTGSNDVSGLMSLLGLGDAKNNTRSRLDVLTDSAVNMMDSITNAVNSASDSNVTGSLKDTLDQARGDISSFTDESKQSIRDVSDSLNTSLESLDDFLDEFDGKGDELSDLIDNLNDSLDKGKDDVDDSKDKLSNRLDKMEKDIDDVIDNLDDTNEELKKLLRQLKYVSGDVGDSVSDTMENLDNLVLNMSKELKGLKDTIKSFKDVLDKLGSTLPTLKPLPTLGPMIRPTATPSNGGSDSSGGNSGGSDSNNDTSSESVKSEDDIDPGYNVTPDGELDSSYDVEPSVVGMLKDMLFTTAKAAEADDEKTAISDLKSTDISLPRLIGDENADTALVKYCINNGTVDGTESTGGVVGCVGFESIVRSGENLTLPDGTKVNSDSVLKAVIDSCISFGNVTAESKYAGGICGKSDIGDIKNSLTTGEIAVNDGSYSGGTAGYTSGNIDNCIAINDVDGNDHIGGIAGSAKNINTSYSLPRLDGKKDDAGAIVGFVDGDVTGCYFIDEGLSGISGMNLEGRAEAVKPDDMTTADGSFPSRMPLLDNGNFYMADGDKFLPQIKSLAQNDAESIGAILQSKSTELSRFHFNVIFKDKDKELKSMTVDYGTVLNDSDIPKLTADGSEVPMWDKDVKSPIIRHTTFSAEYNKATTTISSGEEPPLMLAESVFADNTTLSLKEEDVDHVFDGYKNGKAYSFTLSKDAYDVIKVHIRDDKKKAAKIAVQIDGKWSMVDCTIDGSYAVFETAKPCKYVLLYKKISPIVPIAICGGVAVLMMAAFVVLRRIKKHGRSKEKENV